MPQEKTTRLYLADLARLAGMSRASLEHYVAAARSAAEGRPVRRRTSMPLPDGQEDTWRRRLWWNDPGPAREWAEQERGLRPAGDIPELPGGQRPLFAADVAALLGVTPATVLTYRTRAGQRARAEKEGRPWKPQPGDDLPPAGGEVLIKGHPRPWWSYETLQPYLRARRSRGRPRADGPPPGPDPATARRAVRLLERARRADPSASWPDLVRQVAEGGALPGMTEADIAALYPERVGALYDTPGGNHG